MNETSNPSQALARRWFQKAENDPKAERIISIFRGNFYHGDTEGAEHRIGHGTMFSYFSPRSLCTCPVPDRYRVSVVRMTDDEMFTPTY